MNECFITSASSSSITRVMSIRNPLPEWAAPESLVELNPVSEEGHSRKNGGDDVDECSLVGAGLQGRDSYKVGTYQHERMDRYRR